MTLTRTGVALGATGGVLLLVLGFGQLRTAPQARGQHLGFEGRPSRREAPENDLAADAKDAPRSAASVPDALLRPFDLPFAKETTLEEVAAHLRKTLKAPVVLDRAALKRAKITDENTVRLELQGVRLKTGLKLLLDQVGLTYRVVPEDNLLIITDAQGAEDPIEQVFGELQALHRDLHDLQDMVDELRSALGVEEGGPKMRAPTIIEEVPEDPNAPPPEKPAKPRPG